MSPMDIFVKYAPHRDTHDTDGTDDSPLLSAMRFQSANYRKIGFGKYHVRYAAGLPVESYFLGRDVALTPP
jgi:hypothetical protein